MKITIRGKQKHPRVRKILWEDNKYCCWCGIKTVLLNGFQHTKDNQPPDNMATIEHIYSRITEIPRMENNEKLIACYRCNMQRAKFETRIFRKQKRPLTLEQSQHINSKLKKLYNK